MILEHLQLIIPQLHFDIKLFFQSIETFITFILRVLDFLF